jgi:hypothetical protein
VLHGERSALRQHSAIRAVYASRNQDVSRRAPADSHVGFMMRRVADCSRATKSPVSATMAVCRFYRLGHSASTRVRCRMVKRLRGRFLAKVANSARAWSRLLPAKSSCSTWRPIGDQRVVGFFAEEVVVRQLVQPASRSRSALNLKRERKIAASIGSVKQ